MIQHFRLLGDLKFDQHKTIACDVHLKVDIYEDDDWAEPSIDYKPENYIDGVRITGEFWFDHSPIYDTKHPIKTNAVGKLTVRDSGEFTTFSILVTEQKDKINILPRQVIRYHWEFFAIGKPSQDQLKIFPEYYTGVKMYKLYACTNFRGYWPVQVASVIVANTKQEAKELLEKKLRDSGIPIETDFDYALEEISLRDKGATILNNGEWM